MASYNDKTANQLSRVKAYFRSQGPLYFQTGDKLIIPRVSLEETFDTILKNIRVADSTVDERGNVVTRKAQRRTLKELYRLMYAVHPKLRLSSLIELIIGKMKGGYCDSIICTTINKRVFYFTNQAWSNRNDVSKVFSGQPIDEFGLDWQDILRKNGLEAAWRNGVSTFGSTIGEEALHLEKI